MAKESIKPEVTIVYAEDWEGIYVNGILAYENHSVRADEALQAVGISVIKMIADDEWLEDLGNLPEKLQDVKGELDE